MCGDPDMVTYSVYEDRAWDMYLNNEKAIEEAIDRFEDVSGWKFGAPLAHIPALAMEYLFEATMTYSFGFYRSAISCCASVLDLELKRNLIEQLPQQSALIRKETFGQSIRRFKSCSTANERDELASKIEYINRVRNRVAVHSSATATLVSLLDDETPLLAGKECLSDYITPEERDRVEEEAIHTGHEPDWLRYLASKVVWETKFIIGEYGF